MKRLLRFFMVVTLLSCQLNAQCPSVVKDVNEESEWNELIAFTPKIPTNKNIKFVQTIKEHGSGDLNVDFYSITIDKPTDIDVFYDDFRKDFKNLVFKNLPSSLSNGAFKPYSEEDNTIWISNQPLGALMSFDMVNYSPSQEEIPFIKERGSVVVSCFSNKEWVFTTVNTSNDGFHPVSGNRMFGVIENPDNTLTIYTQGADRVTEKTVYSTFPVNVGTLRIGDLIWKDFLEELTVKHKDLNPRSSVKFNKQIKFDSPSSSQQSPVTSNLNINDYVPDLPGIQNYNYLNGFSDYQTFHLVNDQSYDSKELESKITESFNDGENDIMSYYLGIYAAGIYQKELKSTFMNFVENGVMQNDFFGKDGLDRIEEMLLAKNINALVYDNNGVGINGKSDKVEYDILSENSSLNKLVRGVSNVEIIKEQIYDGIGQEYLDILNNQIESFERELLALGNNYLAEELEIDNELAGQILKLNDLINNKISWEDFRDEMKRNIDQKIYQLALRSGNCICFPLGCSNFQSACTGYWFYNKVTDWDFSLKEIRSWLGELYPELDSFNEFSNYYEKLNQYADHIETAIAFYRKAESIRKIINSIESLTTGLSQLSSLNMKSALRAELRWRSERLNHILYDSDLSALNLVNWKNYRESSGDKFPLLNVMNDFENVALNVSNDLRTLSGLFEELFDDQSELESFISHFETLLNSISDRIIPLIEDFYYSISLDEMKLIERSRSLKVLYDSVLKNNKLDELNSISQYAYESVMLELIDLLSKASNESELRSLSSNQEVDTDSINEDQGFKPRHRSYSSLVKEIEGLYKFQTTSDIRDRFNETSYPFFYFRQFPPYFYQMALLSIYNDVNYKDFQKTIEDYRGWVMGDVHPQNFGTVMPSKIPTNSIGELKVVMNDPDDGGEGSLFLDFMRFLVGIELLENGLASNNFDKIVQVYFSGLRNESHNFSNVTTELVSSRDFYNDRTIQENKLDNKVFAKDKYLVPHNLTSPLSKDEINYAQSEIKKFFNEDAKIEDHYKYRRLKGGSGGNLRWEVLVSVEQEKKINKHTLNKNYYWIEFKMLGLIPGNFPASFVDYDSMTNITLINNAINRYRTNIIIGQGSENIPLYKFVQTPSGPAMMRYRHDGNEFYPIEKLKWENNGGLLKMVLDQAYLTGTIQRNGFSIWNQDKPLVDLEDYIQNVSNLSSTDLIDFIKEQQLNLENDFKIILDRDNNLLADYFKIVESELAAIDPNNEVNEARFKALVIKEYHNKIDEKDRSALRTIEDSFTIENEVLKEMKELIVVEDKRNRAYEPKMEIKIDSPDQLCIYEINANPEEINFTEKEKGWSKSDFEFIIIANISNEVIRTDGIYFKKGVEHNFRRNVEIAPGELILIGGNINAIKHRYLFDELFGDIKIAYEGNFESDTGLNKSGENLVLVRLMKDDFNRTVETTLIKQSYTFNATQEEDHVSMINFSFMNRFGSNADSGTWVEHKRKTNYALHSSLIPVAVNYHGIDKSKSDFIVLRNTSDRSLDARGLEFTKGINFSFSFVLSPNEEIMIGGDVSYLRREYGNSHRIYEYGGKLKNSSDKLKLVSNLNEGQEKKIWELSYSKDWFVRSNGKGAYIIPKSVCSNIQFLEERVGWVERSGDFWNIEFDCEPKILVDMCNGYEIGQEWEVNTSEGIKIYKCIRDGHSKVLIEN